MKIMTKLFLILGVVAIAACSFADTSAGTDTNTDSASASAPNPQRVEALAKIDIFACLDSGGIIKNVCMMRLPACVQVHADAGKTCSDSANCAGECRVVGEFVAAGGQSVGVCSADSNPCGCFQRIDAGLAQAPLCVD